MCLSLYEIKEIIQSAKQIFAHDVHVILFGRTDDSQKGSDIDLYIQTYIKLKQCSA